MFSDYTMNITLYNRDELFVVHLESVAYFKAEDHFSRVFYINGTDVLLPFGLADICEYVCKCDDPSVAFMRIGRSLFLNLHNVSHVNLLKEKLTFVDNYGKSVSLTVSKRLLRSLLRILKVRIRSVSRFYSVFLHFTMQLIRLTNYAFELKILLFYFF